MSVCGYFVSFVVVVESFVVIVSLLSILCLFDGVLNRLVVVLSLCSYFESLIILSILWSFVVLLRCFESLCSRLNLFVVTLCVVCGNLIDFSKTKNTVSLCHFKQKLQHRCPVTLGLLQSNPIQPFICGLR